MQVSYGLAAGYAGGSVIARMCASELAGTIMGFAGSDRKGEVLCGS